MDDKNQLQCYSIWSNFIYFISGIYSILISFRLRNLHKNDSLFFFLWGAIIISTGVISIIYHVNNPSWTYNPNTVDSKSYKDLLVADMSLSITSIFIGIFFLIYRFCQCYINKKIKILLYSSNLWFSLIFIILSTIFFFLSHNSFKECINCKQESDCFDENLDKYDVFHSNWHIFSGITSIFWLITLNETY